MSAYEEAISATAAPHAPWYVIPADRKWLMRLAVLSALVGEMESLDLKFPVLSDAEKAKLAAARANLLES